jgi:hypothetical protein
MLCSAIPSRRCCCVTGILLCQCEFCGNIKGKVQRDLTRVKRGIVHMLRNLNKIQDTNFKVMDTNFKVMDYQL